MTKNQKHAKALLEEGDTRDAYLAKLQAAKIPYTVEERRLLGEYREGRDVTVRVSVFVQGSTAADFIEPE